MTKKFLWIGGTLLAGTISYFIFRPSANEKTYKTDTIQRGELSVVITATGKVNPVMRVQVGTQVTGTISKISADFNQKVKKGQIIAEIDPTFLKAQLLEAEANSEKAKAQSDQSKKTLDRATELFDRKLISQSEKDEALTNYNLAIAQYKQAGAAYHRAEVSLQYTTIVSPIDGIVISRNVDVGQTVAASLQAPILFVIANDLAKIQVEATIDEVDIGKVKMGQDVSFYVDAYPEERFKGRVAQVRLQPIVLQNLVSYEVIIEVENRENKLLPGMTANLSIIVDTKKDVLKVANMALRFQPVLTQAQFKIFSEQLGEKFDLKNNSMVWMLTGTELTPLVVDPGISDGQYTEIRSDKVKESMVVITGISTVGPSTNPGKRLTPGK